jgi:hypothetical protein
MEQYELGVAAARERIAALHREAADARLGRSRRQAAAIPGRGGTTMQIEHQHKPGSFDPGQCRDCARETDLLDHYDHVQRQEWAFREAHRWARHAHRAAAWALGSAGVGVLLATTALLTD